ncbi:MAG: hypothetical protein JXA20_08750 [Spirochaetes bacterium]|nr:hypothetical protein [Spirochaetota bacterium]
MRIYSFSEVRGRKSNGYLPVSADAPRRRMMPLASGGEDIVEISGRALQLYRRERVVALERARIERATRELMPDIREAMDVEMIRSAGGCAATAGEAGISADAVIAETADRILGFLAG